MDPQRFFIALLPPPQVCTQVTQIKQEFEADYGSRKALNSPPHITLQVPFDWTGDTEKLIRGLEEFAQQRRPIAIAHQGFGAFAPRVIYINVTATKELTALQQQLDKYMHRHHGTSPHPYPSFHPHMTVAFRDLTPAAFHQAWPQYQRRSIEFNYRCSALTLLHHNGQRWQPYQSFPFTGGHA